MPLADVSPTRQGVDHRQVQKELEEVVVQLQDPVVLTSTTIQVTWTVSTSVVTGCCFSDVLILSIQANNQHIARSL